MKTTTYEKFRTEEHVRSECRHSYGDDEIIIIKSDGCFYIEDRDEVGMIRTWERVIYRGLGRKA